MTAVTQGFWMAPMSKKRILRVAVTGADGMLGRRVMEELRNAGYDAVGLTRADADLKNAAATHAAFERIRPDAVIHLAARVAGLGGNRAAPGEMFYQNTMMNTNVVEAARLVGVAKFVAVGSTAIYSDLVRLPMREADIWLGAPHESEAPYAHANRGMLAQLQAYRQQYELEFAYAVLTNSFGPDDRFNEHSGHVMPSLISKFHRAKRDGTAVTIWGTGKPRRDFIYSKDAARAFRLLMETGEGAVNVASGTEVSIRELVTLMADVSGFTGEVLWDDTKPAGQALRKYDTARLDALGFAPGHDLRRGVAETYEWYEKNVGGTRL